MYIVYTYIYLTFKLNDMKKHTCKYKLEIHTSKGLQSQVLILKAMVDQMEYSLQMRAEKSNLSGEIELFN